MEHPRPDGRKSLFMRLAAVGIACSSLALANCSGGGGTSLPRAPVGGTPAPTGSPTVSPSSSPSVAPSSSPSARPSTSPSAGPTPTATPTSTPTATPTATPTSVPTSVPSTGPGFACTTPSATFGPNYYASVIVIGNVPAGGGAFGIDTSNSLWSKASFAPRTATPVPTSTPTTSPTTAPTPPPTRPFYLYTGTYHIDSASAPTDGCFMLFTTTDGSSISGVPYSGEGIGFVNPPQSDYTENTNGFGHVSAVSLNLSPSAPNVTGTIALDSGDNGTIAISAVQTVQLPLNRIRDPRSFIKKH